MRLIARQALLLLEPVDRDLHRIGDRSLSRANPAFASALARARDEGSIRNGRRGCSFGGRVRSLRHDVRRRNVGQNKVGCRHGSARWLSLGLFLVASLADRWGTAPYPPSGKCVWAEIDLTPEAAGCISGQQADEPVARHDHPA